MAASSPAFVLYERPHRVAVAYDPVMDRAQAVWMADLFANRGFLELLPYTLAAGIDPAQVALTEGMQ